MPYNKRGWSPITPLSVANLTAMDEGIYQNSLAVEAAKVQEITSFNAATDPTKLYSVTSDDNNYFVIVTRSETKITQFRFKNRTDISTPNIEIRNGSIDEGNIIWAGSWAKLIDVPSKTSDLINDSGFLTAHQDISGKVDKSRKIAGVDLQDDITTAELITALAVPSKTSQLANDSGFLTAHQDISGKVDKTQTIAGLALSGNIGSAALAEAMAGNINPVGVIPGTTTGYGAQFGYNGSLAPCCSYELLTAAVEASKKLGLSVVPGPICSHDVFYSQGDYNSTPILQKLGVLCVEMEAYALYLNAAASGKNALALLTISDSLVTGESLPAEDRQNTFTDMMEIALEIA